jgi:hypothetical protein
MRSRQALNNAYGASSAIRHVVSHWPQSAVTGRSAGVMAAAKAIHHPGWFAS